MTEPLPPLFSLTTDIARQTTQQKGIAAVLQAISALSAKVDLIMTEDAAVAAKIQQISDDTAATLAAVRALQSLITALQAEVSAGNLSQATLDALDAATAASDALRGEAEGDVTSDTPPSGA